jgi:hypothetical protein
MPAQKPGQKPRQRTFDTPSGMAEVAFVSEGQKVRLQFVLLNTGSGGGSQTYFPCAVPDCLGYPLIEGLCICHASAIQRSHYLSDCVTRKRHLDLTGVELTQSIFDEIRASPVFKSDECQIPILMYGAKCRPVLHFCPHQCKQLIAVQFALVIFELFQIDETKVNIHPFCGNSAPQTPPQSRECT